MIVWLNGAFGAGKTTTAAALVPLLSGFRVFDPETVGHLLAANLVDLPVDDFQHWPAWRPLVVATALELRRQTGQNLVAPQTVLEQDSWYAIASGLRQQDEVVLHVVLDVGADALRARVLSSPQAQEWRLSHVDRYIAARRWLLADADLVVDVSALSAAQAAASIAERVATTPRQVPAPPCWTCPQGLRSNVRSARMGHGQGGGPASARGAVPVGERVLPG